MTTSSRSPRSEISSGGILILVLGAWAAVAPFALGLGDLGARTVLPGATVALGGAAILAGARSVVGGALLALAGALWLTISPLAGLFGPDSALTLGQWLGLYLGPGALIMLATVHVLGRVEIADPAEERARRRAHGPARAARTRDPHRRVGERAPRGAHRRELHGARRHVRGDA